MCTHTHKLLLTHTHTRAHTCYHGYTCSQCSRNIYVQSVSLSHRHASTFTHKRKLQSTPTLMYAHTYTHTHTHLNHPFTFAILYKKQSWISVLESLSALQVWTINNSITGCLQLPVPVLHVPQHGNQRRNQRSDKINHILK